MSNATASGPELVRIADVRARLVVGLEWHERPSGRPAVQIARSRSAHAHVATGGSVGLAPARGFAGQRSAAGSLAAASAGESIVILADVTHAQHGAGYWYCLLTAGGVQRDQLYTGSEALAEAQAQAASDRLILGDTTALRCLGHPPPALADLFRDAPQDAGGALRRALRESPRRLVRTRSALYYPLRAAVLLGCAAAASFAGWQFYQAREAGKPDPEALARAKALRDHRTLYEAHTRGPTFSEFSGPLLAHLARHAPPYVVGWRRSLVHCSRESAFTPGGDNTCTVRYTRAIPSAFNVLHLSRRLGLATLDLFPMRAATPAEAARTVLSEEVATFRLPMPDFEQSLALQQIPDTAIHELAAACQDLSAVPGARCDHRVPETLAFSNIKYVPLARRFRLGGMKLVVPLYAMPQAAAAFDALPFLQLTSLSLGETPAESATMDASYVLR